MKLAFALMAAINGSTGSSATLSSGLQLPHQASSASTRRHVEFSRSSWVAAQAARDAVLKYAAISDLSGGWEQPRHAVGKTRSRSWCANWWPGIADERDGPNRDITGS